MSDSEENIDRRRFLGKSAALIAGSAALPSTALSYERIVGANDRISLAHIGTGSRGSDLDWIVAQLRTSQNAEMTVICDLWKLNREKAAATNAKYHGRAPRKIPWPGAANFSVFGGCACAERRRRSDYFHAGTFALADSQNDSGSGQGRVR